MNNNWKLEEVNNCTITEFIYYLNQLKKYLDYELSKEVPSEVNSLELNNIADYLDKSYKYYTILRYLKSFVNKENI